MTVKSKKIPGRLIALGAVALAAAIFGGYRLWSMSRPVDFSQLYSTAAVSQGDVTVTVAGEARVKAPDPVSIFLEMPQDVSAVYIKEGDPVVKGQLLVDYDNSTELAELSRRLTEAQLYSQNAKISMETITRPPAANDLIQYENAVINAQKAVTDLEYEIESLKAKLAAAGHRATSERESADVARDEYKHAIIDENDYDVALSNYRAAQAEQADIAVQLEAKTASKETYDKMLESAKQQLKNAQDPLSDPATQDSYKIQQNLAEVQSLAAQDIEATIAKYTSKTLSPIDGVVLSVNVVDGGVAGTSSAVVKLADKSKAVIMFEVPEFEAPNIALGQTARVTVGGIEGKVYSGEVTKIYEQAVEKVDSNDDEYIVPVEITLSNADAALKIGYTVNAEIITDQRQGVLSLPLGAIFPDGEGYSAYIIEDGALIKRELSVGFSGDKTVEILGGINENDLVVLNPREVNPKHVSEPASPSVMVSASK